MASNEGSRWFRAYDETPLFTREQVEATLVKFLDYAGYRLCPPAPIGFMKPDLVAARAQGKPQPPEILFVVREGINHAVEGFRDLAAAKCFRGDAVDYVLALPPVSEHFMIEFLIEQEEWFFPIKDQLFQIWLVNPDKDKVDCLMGWPRDDDFKHYFSNPNLAGFATFIGNKATAKIMADEFE